MEEQKSVYRKFIDGSPLTDKDLRDIIKFSTLVQEMLGDEKKFWLMLNELSVVANRCRDFQEARKEH